MMGEAVMEAYGACIRCGHAFGFDPETVPSTSVHPATMCPIRPDGTTLKPGDADAIREPLCPPCVHVFRAAGGKDRPIGELFPLAHLGLIDVGTARRIQAGAR
jgi:hypothetical protein